MKSGLCSTIQQLCQALLAQLGQGRSGTGIGMGGGGLYGGNPADGYWSFGSSLLEIPLHGPARHAFMNRTGLGRGHGGDGQGRAGSVQATESIDSPATGAVETRTISLDEIPERYREPARIFYRIDELSPGAPPHE